MAVWRQFWILPQAGNSATELPLGWVRTGAKADSGMRAACHTDSGLDHNVSASLRHLDVLAWRAFSSNTNRSSSSSISLLPVTRSTFDAGISLVPKRSLYPSQNAPNSGIGRYDLDPKDYEGRLDS